MITVEFMGMPKTGKTTQIDLVEDALEDNNGYKVGSVAESAMKSPLDKDNHFKYNAWCFHETANKIMEQQLRDDLDYLFVDRGIYDRMVFDDVLYKKSKISKESRDIHKEYVKQFTDLEDKVVAFLVEPQTSLEREFGDGGRVMNGDFLGILYESYQDILSQIEDVDLKVVDASNDMREVRDEVYRFLEMEDESSYTEDVIQTVC